MRKVCALLFILTFIIVTPSIGQSNKGQVILKNGSIIKGKIYEEDNGERIRIFSAGNIWVFQKSEIDKMVFYHQSKPLTENDTLLSRFSVHTETGVLIGSSENSQEAPLFFQSTIDYSLTSRWSAGIGTGVEFLKETHIPVFARFKYKFRDSGYTPYLFLQAGYAFPAEDANSIYPEYPIYYYTSSIWPGPWYTNQELLKGKGGVMLNPGIGFQKMFSPYFGMSFSFGYYFSRLSYTGDNDYKIDLDYNRLSLKLGIIFK